VYVNDAFGTAHRAHASTAGVVPFISGPHVAGLLMGKELKYLRDTLAHPRRPFAAIVGGAKVSTKIGVLESLLSQVNDLIIGGGMIFTFLKAKGLPIGKSLVENDSVQLAKELMTKAAAKNVRFYLPSDVVVAEQATAEAAFKVVSYDQIPEGWMGLDIGPNSVEVIAKRIKQCKTVVWNGPMGMFELKHFANGTIGVARALAEATASGCTSIIGGGDSVAALEQAGLSSKMSHISTGGGACLEMLEGKELPGVSALDDN